MKPLPKKRSSPHGAPLEAKPTMGMDRKRMRSRGPHLRAVGLTFSLSAIGVWAIFSFWSPRTAALQLDRSIIATVDETTFAEFVPVTGVLAPETMVTLGSVEGGRVTQIFVEDGQFLSAGDPILTLQNRDLELAVLTREAQLTEQLSNLANAQMAFDRMMNDYERDVIAAMGEISIAQDALDRRKPIAGDGATLETVRHLEIRVGNLQDSLNVTKTGQTRDRQIGTENIERLQRSVDRLSAGLDLLRGSLNELTVRAPIAGQISGLSIEVGEVIPAGTELGQISRDDEFLARARIDEFYLGRITVGQTAVASLDGRDYALRIAKIYPSVENRLFEVDMVFGEDRPSHMRRGQTAQVRITLSANEKTLTLPNGPYYDQAGSDWVFVQTPDGRAADKRVVTFGRRNADKIEIISGLSRGERVLVSSYEGFTGMDRINFETE